MNPVGEGSFPSNDHPPCFHISPRVNRTELMLHETTRGDCFRFLSACFYPPDRELFLQESLFRNLATALNQIAPATSDFSKKMEEAFLHYCNEDMRVEYARLFVGPFELKAPPYGSVYLEHERRVMGDSTMAVLKMYEEAGLVMDEDFKELPDHVAVELEFMSYLIYQEVQALEQSMMDRAIKLKTRQELFLNRFLKPWIPPFCREIKENTENEFYEALADCLFTFVEKQSPAI